MLHRTAISICVLLSASGGVFAAERPNAIEFFEMRIRPVLAKRCYACHASTPMSGLDLSRRETLLKGGSRGPAFSTNKPGESLLIQAVSYKLDGLKMPP